MLVALNAEELDDGHEGTSTGCRVGRVALAAGGVAAGQAVRARLAIRLADSLGGEALKVEVEATDMRGARQLVRAGAVRVAG